MTPESTSSDNPQTPRRRNSRRRYRRPRSESHTQEQRAAEPAPLANQEREAKTKTPAQQPRRTRPQSHGGRPRLSIVIPLFNEASSLAELHGKISAALQDFRIPAEIIFIDDGSSDRSFEVLREIQQRDRRVRVVQFRRNFGKSAALAAGFERAVGQFIVTMDADLQDDPAEIKPLLDEMKRGDFDLVSGWKRERHDPFIKKFSSKVFNRVTAFMTGLRLHDINCGLKAYRREVTNSIPVYGELHRFLPVLAFKEGFRVGEVVVKHHPRKHGKSKFGPSRFSKGFFDLITVLFLSRYTKRPLHLFGVAGTMAFIAGLGIAGYLTYERLVLKSYLTNRPVLFLALLLMIIGVQAVSIGLLGEMITAANTHARAYFVREELGGDKNWT
ncbi:MAG: glycosyltransferase family 2 protein [candidate division KSB1 bacterium]